MKQIANSSFSDAALNQLGISHCEFPYRNGGLLFCKIPSTKMTFDLQYSQDGTVRLWRFVGCTEPSKAGMRCEYRDPNHPHSIIGVEVSDESEVMLYAEQLFACDDKQREKRLIKMIEGYLKLISNLPVQILSW